MKVNIAVFDRDSNYVSRLQKGFVSNYPKQANIKVFSDEEVFLADISASHFDIILVEQDYLDKMEKLPKHIKSALLVKDNGIMEHSSIPAIGKYQSIEEIYKRIVGICAEGTSGIKLGSGHISNIIMFTSAQGGAGTSTLAAAYAIAQARKGKKIFYLNMETFGSSNIFFQGEGNGSFSDVIYALKSQNVNLVMKLQSTVKRDDNNVFFIDSCKNSFDMLEIKDREIGELIEGISSIDEFDAIVLDYSDILSPRHLLLMRDFADTIVYVNDGSVIGNQKFIRFCEALRVIEKREDVSIINKINLIYNRFSSKTSSQLDTIPVKLLGGINRIEGLLIPELLAELSQKDALTQIL